MGAVKPESLTSPSVQSSPMRPAWVSEDNPKLPKRWQHFKSPSPPQGPVIPKVQVSQTPQLLFSGH